MATEEVEQFSFEREAAEIQADMVSEMNVTVIDSNRAKVTLTSLELERYELDWSI